MTMTREELNEKLELHRKWLENEDGGARLNLRDANLRDVKLSYSDLSGANLRYADLKGANLKDANFDYSTLPLFCGSLRMHIDDRIAVQLLYHAASTVLYSKHTSDELKRFCGSEEMLSWANRFHRVDECGKLPRDEKE